MCGGGEEFNISGLLVVYKHAFSSPPSWEVKLSGEFLFLSVPLLQERMLPTPHSFPRLLDGFSLRKLEIKALQDRVRRSEIASYGNTLSPGS